MDPVSSYYLQQGVLGVTIVVLAGVVLWQQRRLDKKDQELREVLENRLKDSKEYSTVYNGTTEKYATLAEKTNNNDALLMQAVNGIATFLQNKLK